jgi:CRP-like cAMP-binding protein
MMFIEREGGQARPVLRRLNALRRLSEAGIAAIKTAVQDKILKAAAGEDLVCEGDRPESVRLFLSGWGFRYKVLDDGRRQIVNFILPGDTCDAHVYLFSKLDYSIAALTPVVYSELSREAFERLVSSDTSVAEAFFCEMLAASSIQREWVISLGRRDALERVAHVICELYERLRVVGLVDGNTFAFPVTQMDMADATGLSAVHLNRTLQELRGSGYITLKDRSLTIHDFQALSNTAMFNLNYLHLDRK